MSRAKRKRRAARARTWSRPAGVVSSWFAEASIDRSDPTADAAGYSDPSPVFAASPTVYGLPRPLPVCPRRGLRSPVIPRRDHEANRGARQLSSSTNMHGPIPFFLP